jgi:predicted PurR-regulated permease PerM
MSSHFEPKDMPERDRNHDMGRDPRMINISFNALFKIALFIGGIFLLYQLRSVVLIVLSAVVIASVLEPGTRFFIKKKIPRAISVILMYTILIGLILAFVSFILPPLFNETVSALNSLPRSIKTADIFNGLHNGAFSSARAIFPELPATVSVGDLVGTVTNSLAIFSGGTFSAITGFFGGVLSLILMFVISFYLSVRQDGVGEFLAIVTPVKHEEYVKNLWKRSERKIGKWMQGQLLLGLIVGILTYIALLVLGVKHPLLLAAVAAVFELIPVVGMTLSAIPAFFLATLDGGFGLGLIVVAAYIIIQQIEAHFIYPLVVKKVVGVPPLLVIIALVAGAELAGFVGILLSIPISVAIVEFIDDLDRRKRFVSE